MAVLSPLLNGGIELLLAWVKQVRSSRDCRQRRHIGFASTWFRRLSRMVGKPSGPAAAMLDSSSMNYSMAASVNAISFKAVGLSGSLKSTFGSGRGPHGSLNTDEYCSQSALKISLLSTRF